MAGATAVRLLNKLFEAADEQPTNVRQLHRRVNTSRHRLRGLRTGCGMFRGASRSLHPAYAVALDH
jgi:hypothetical protein